MVTITMNDDFTLVCDTNVIPAQHSANIPFKFEVPEEYKDAIVVPGYIYYDGDRKNESAVSDYNNGQFSITNGFIKDGILGISFALTNGNLTETTTIIEFEVRRSVNTSFSLPSSVVWQDMLKNFMDQYMDKVYSSVIEDLIQKEEEHYQTTEQLQSKVNDLIKKSKQQQLAVEQLTNDINSKLENGEFVPQFTMGTVETLPAGQPAKAEITGTRKQPILNLDIPQGLQGAQGIQGVQGLQGPKGAQGERGLQGIQGPQGPKGEVGNVGPQGATGPQGAQGIQGPKGDKGDKGDRGTSGITTPLNGFFTLYVDSNGNLYARTAGTAEQPPFRYDELTGNLYWGNQ